MALGVKDAEADSLARQVAALTGETLTAAVPRWQSGCSGSG